jgi:4-hydroxythreonine-4-phosphate dehydrogenase
MFESAQKSPLPIAITMGDAAGIGPEIIAKAFRDAPELTSACFVVGQVSSLRRAAQMVAGTGIAMPTAVITQASDALRCPPNCLPVLSPGASCE